VAKDRKGKLPKRLAGVKIPKELRKGGERLLASAQTPEGRAAIARGAAVVASAAAAMAHAANRPAANRSVVTEPARAPSETPDAGAANTDALGDAIGAGVEAVLGRLFTRR
jgi:hypothetical protein